MLYDTGYYPRMALSYDGQKRINDCRLGENKTMKDKWSIINFNACRSTQGRKEREEEQFQLLTRSNVVLT